MKTKICANPKCKKELPISEFTKDTHRKDGLNPYCKTCHKERGRNFRKKNREKINDNLKEYYKKFPWKKFLNIIKQRCNNKNRSNYKDYGGKGIKCLITEKQIKYLWFRDKAYLMKKPSIDRKNPKKNYTVRNCQFIELSINVGKDKNKSVLQYDKNGNFIQEFKSEQEAIKILGLKSRHIHEVASGKLKTAHGFIWKWKNEK